MTETFKCLTVLTSVFTKPSAEMFLKIAAGWILCHSRRTLTNVYRFGDLQNTTNVDATHYFFRDAAWESAELWKLWAIYTVSVFAPKSPVLTLVLDDTAFHKSGLKINGARTCRDAASSARNNFVKCWGLQFVPLCLLVHPPWGGEPLSIPVNIRLNRKADEGEAPVTLLDHAKAMLRELAEWFPDRSFRLVADGAYAPLAGQDLPRTQVVFRIRSDAAIYELPSRHPGQRGRPRVTGERLPAPADIVVQSGDWRLVETVERGQKRKRLVYTQLVMWAHVTKKPVLLIISRDPEGQQKDDFFFSTDVFLYPEQVVGLYSDRWSIEDTFRNVKQFLGAEEPQSWKRNGPERAGAFSFFLYGAVWVERISRQGQPVASLDRPWYAGKTSVSFQDALADLRTRLWSDRIKAMSASKADFAKIQKTLTESLSWAS
jgi:hypothetical protein